MEVIYIQKSQEGATAQDKKSYTEGQGTKVTTDIFQIQLKNSIERKSRHKRATERKRQGIASLEAIV